MGRGLGSVAPHKWVRRVRCGVSLSLGKHGQVSLPVETGPASFHALPRRLQASPFLGDGTVRRKTKLNLNRP